MNKFNYTWDSFFKDAEILAKKLKNQNFEALLIVTNGGLFLGSYLASKLNIKIVETIGLKSYSAENKKEVLELVKQAERNLPARLLIVDDIVDSGETLQYIHDRYKAPSVVLFKKPQTRIQPTFFVYETDQWVVFPWEV